MRVVLLVVLFAFVLPSPAWAELRMSSAGSTPAQLSWPGPVPVTYSLTLAAVGRDETFALTFDQPAFTTDRTGTAPGAFSLMFTGQKPRIDGPATLLGPAST